MAYAGAMPRVRSGNVRGGEMSQRLGFLPGLRGLPFQTSKDLRGMRNARPMRITPSMSLLRQARRTVSTLVCASSAACSTVMNPGMVTTGIVHLDLHICNVHDKMHIV